DGICATALAVLLLRELDADVAWHLPSRFEEGYGLNAGTLTRLAEEGFELVVTVDCGITAVAEVEHARSLGLEVVVTDPPRPAAVDESSIGFRLAPRINASGRLCRPEAALALLLTEDEREAKELGEELETLNRERQLVEERILREAVDQVESWPESHRRRRAYVVA